MAPLAPTCEVRAHQLLARLETFSKLRVLSLDCFDTLLWRQAATPADVFHDMEQSPEWRAAGFTARLRAGAETLARNLRRVRAGNHEVRLAEIYQAAYPDASPELLADLAAAELAAEKRTCYAFPPTVELIRAARQKGLRVVVVSDIYLDEAQLRELLAATLPPDAYAAIDRVYASSDHRMGKTDGLFNRVVSELGVRPGDILHIGDSAKADLDSAQTAGLRALRLIQNEVGALSVLRMQGTAMAMLDPTVRHTAPVPSPYHGVLACSAADEDVTHLVGYAAIGPVLYGFGRFILDELEALRATGRRVKPLFLMRDAYLPQQVVESIVGGEVGHPVAISRFASFASSFRTSDDVDRYLCRFAGSKRFDDVCRQLLLPEEISRPIIAAAGKKNRPVEEFLRRVRRPEVLELIFAASKRYRTRLFRYLERECGLARGDTLMFIDLGYEGTAQRLLEPVFKDELDVEVVGRYLMVVGTPGWERSRRGLIDPSWCDERAIMALVDYVSILENVCTSDGQSVIDYDEDGLPKFAPAVIAPEQMERVKPVQEACRAFAADAESFFGAVGRRPSPEAMRRAALGMLGRLFYLPGEAEMTFLEGFHLDMGLATSDSLRLFDPEQGMTGLRRRGLFFMEQGLKQRRLNYPIELRHAGVELAVMLLAQQRFRLGFVHNDFSMRREAVRFVISGPAGESAAVAEARSTHDGFFSLIVPLGDADRGVAVLVGQTYAWMQIESVDIVGTRALYKDDESLHTEDISDRVVPEGMEARGPGLYECGPDAFLFIPPLRKRKVGGRVACRIVYRPIAHRVAEVAAEAVAA